MQNLLADDSLADFVANEITLLGETRTVHIAGKGPAVIVMPEMPGISPHVARFARWVREAGFTVYMPSLFGRDGVVPDAAESARIFRKACVSAEFRALGGGASSPVTAWLRALAREAHQACGGAGVGAIGMCFTGNFALTMMLESSVLAPVVSQPSLPWTTHVGLEIGEGELSQIRDRLEREDLTVRAYRFAGDSFCKAERFAAYAKALGDRFESRVLPDDSASQSDRPPFHANFVMTPHSVVTVDLIDAAGQPTLAARDEILQFFKDRLSSDHHVAES